MSNNSTDHTYDIGCAAALTIVLVVGVVAWVVVQLFGR